MAVRPAFYVKDSKVVSRDVSFEWFAGFSLAQKQRSISAMHNALIAADNSAVPLEISTKGTDPLGVKLSAFNLKLDGYALENVFQSSKVFENGGPYRDLLDVHPKEAKRDERIRNSGRIIGFNYAGNDFPTEPKTAFYDYIYICAVRQSLTFDEIQNIWKYSHFTDIEFNPSKSLNTQARTAAIIRLMLDVYGDLPLFSVDEFIEFHKKCVKA